MVYIFTTKVYLGQLKAMFTVLKGEKKTLFKGFLVEFGSNNHGNGSVNKRNKGHLFVL